MNNHDKSIIQSFLMYLDANNLYGWAMCQKLSIGGFKWVKHLLKFNESFIKGYNENSDRGYFLEVDVEYPKNLFISHKDLPFLPEGKKLEKVKKNLKTKKICCSHKSFKTSIKSWINTKKCIQCNSI